MQIKKFIQNILSLNSKITDIENQIKKAKEINALNTQLNQKLANLLQNIDVSVDVHEHSRSWAVISIQGHNTDYIKFIDLGQADAQHIQHFIRQFDRNVKIDASPTASKFLAINRM